MRLPFNEAKATEAAARLLEKSGGKMKYLQLIKLLYFADREALFIGLAVLVHDTNGDATIVLLHRRDGL